MAMNLLKKIFHSRYNKNKINLHPNDYYLEQQHQTKKKDENNCITHNTPKHIHTSM